MRTLAVTLIFGMLVSSCGNTQNGGQNNSTADTPAELPPPAIDTMYFVHTEGLDNGDSTFVKLIINGKQIEGDMLWFPAEKDYRLGHIQGTLVDNIINAGWVYIQEGTKQNLNVSFKLVNGKLFEKPHVVNPKLGIEELPDTGAYTKEYAQIQRTRFPERLIALQELPDVIGN